MYAEMYMVLYQCYFDIYVFVLCLQEDTRRYNRLIRFYESLGFTARAGAKVLYLTNYDESFRKVIHLCVYTNTDITACKEYCLQDTAEHV
jgi:hypothetical protein